MGFSLAVATLIALACCCQVQAFCLFYPPALLENPRITHFGFAFRAQLRRAFCRTDRGSRMITQELAQKDSMREKHALCVKRCSGYEEWTPAAASTSSGLLIPRQLRVADFPGIQQRVEGLAEKLHAGEDTLIGARIPMVIDHPSQVSLEALCSRGDAPSESQARVAKMEMEVMDRIRKMLVKNFPTSLVDMVMGDISCICKAMKRLLEGQSNGLQIKIELIGANACKKWHYDNFPGRSIVTYCGVRGTTFVTSPSMRLEEVRNMAAGGQLVPSAQSASIGDILFIKGAKYGSTR